MQNIQTAIARILLASVFLGLVLLKVNMITTTPNGFELYRAELGEYGLPGIFAPLLILVQFVGGIALLVGFKTALFARILAVLALFFAVIASKFSFHSSFIYLGVAGGMLLLSVYPNTPLSVDK